MEDWRTFVDFTTERRPLGKSKIHYRRFRQFTVEQPTIGRSTKICAVKSFIFTRIPGAYTAQFDL